MRNGIAAVIPRYADIARRTNALDRADDDSVVGVDIFD
jgi:hypothetical protein